MHKATNKNKHLRSVEYDLHNDLEKLKAALFDTSHDVKGKAGQLVSQSFENVKQRSADLQEDVGSYVAEKPFKALGITLLTGIIIGYLLHR